MVEGPGGQVLGGMMLVYMEVPGVVTGVAGGEDSKPGTKVFMRLAYLPLGCGRLEHGRVLSASHRVGTW